MGRVVREGTGRVTLEHRRLIWRTKGGGAMFMLWFRWVIFYLYGLEGLFMVIRGIKGLCMVYKGYVWLYGLEGFYMGPKGESQNTEHWSKHRLLNWSPKKLESKGTGVLMNWSTKELEYK